MHLLRTRGIYYPAALILFAAVFAVGQRTRPDFNRASVFDAQHYAIRVSFDRKAKSINGDTTVVLKPLSKDFREFSLDAVGLKFSLIVLEPSGTPLKYVTTPGAVKVLLDRPYQPEETISVRLKYQATPKKGIYFVSAATGNDENNHSAQIWTQGEPNEARHWFPNFDFPSDKATTEQYITAETGETVIGNGQLLETKENGDGTSTWHYRMAIPHSTYLVSFVIGKYSRIDENAGEVPLAFYVYPGREAIGRSAFMQTKRMMPVFEDLTGIRFPYNKYDQTIVASFQFGGMENITATTLADTEVFFGEYDFGRENVTDLVSHELSHSWFGDMVTCKNWAELWLNEGFATYMEAAYREAVNGHGDYIRKIRTDAADFLVDDAITARRHGLFNTRAGEVDRLFDAPAVTYNKGSVVLHMLRELIGRETFWKGVRLYLNRHKFANVESGDLKATMEDASGQDLKWFFDQWVYAAGAPKLTIQPVYSARTRTLKLNVLQTQRLDQGVPAFFRLPLEFDVKTQSGTESKVLTTSARIDSVAIKLSGKPLEIVVDPDEKVPAKTVKLLPIRLER